MTVAGLDVLDTLGSTIAEVTADLLASPSVAPRLGSSSFDSFFSFRVLSFGGDALDFLNSSDIEGEPL